MPHEPRRSFLQALSLGGLLGLGTGAARAQEPSAPSLGGPRREQVVIDIAVLGHTNYSNDGGAANKLPGREGWAETDARGTNYYFEGLVYPGGTIPEASADDPDGVTWDFGVEPMGSFFNRGWVIINNKSDGPYVPRKDPHLLSHCDYYLGGVVGEDNLTPTDMLQSTGMENGVPPDDVVVRAVTGGTGRFATARGQVTQRRVGRNTTPLRGMPFPLPEPPKSPNFRLTFDLVLWDVV